MFAAKRSDKKEKRKRSPAKADRPSVEEQMSVRKLASCVQRAMYYNPDEGKHVQRCLALPTAMLNRSIVDQATALLARKIWAILSPDGEAGFAAASKELVERNGFNVPGTKGRQRCAEVMMQLFANTQSKFGHVLRAAMAAAVSCMHCHSTCHSHLTLCVRSTWCMAILTRRSQCLPGTEWGQASP